MKNVKITINDQGVTVDVSVEDSESINFNGKHLKEFEKISQFDVMKEVGSHKAEIKYIPGVNAEVAPSANKALPEKVVEQQREKIAAEEKTRAPKPPADLDIQPVLDKTQKFVDQKRYADALDYLTLQAKKFPAKTFAGQLKALEKQVQFEAEDAKKKAPATNETHNWLVTDEEQDRLDQKEDEDEELNNTNPFGK